MQPEVLEKHLKQLKDATNGDSILFPPSFVEPGAYWTSAEKDLFFRSIARHSRWRPDLIAEDLGFTKSISDIWAYIQILAESSSAHPPLITSDSLPPSAREMSDKWIAFEEILANEVVSNEARWFRHNNLQACHGSSHVLKESFSKVSPEDSKHQKKMLKRISLRLKFLSKLNRRTLGYMDSLLHDSDDDDVQQSISKSERNASSPDYLPQDGSTSVANVSDTEVSHLSPASRRRLQKRLWTRRKRCLESGISPSKASVSLGKLKRGRKTSTGGRLAKKRSSRQDVDAVQATDEEQANHKRIVLGQHDITKPLLLADGLDIFHLRKFVTLSRWVFDSSGSSDETFMAYETLCYLRSALTYFLTLVIGKTIALRRADLRQRRIIEGNVDIDEIKKENVLASLSSLGQIIDKKDILDRLYAALKFGHDDDIALSVKKQSEPVGRTRIPSKVTAATSFSLLADSREAHLVPTTLSSMNDGNILVEDAYQGDRSKELAADRALEKRFELVDHDYEMRLWHTMGQDFDREVSQKGESEEEQGVDEQ